MPYTTPTYRNTNDTAQAPNTGVASDGQDVIEQAQYEGAIRVEIDGKQRAVSKGATGNASPYVQSSLGTGTTRNNAGVVMPFGDKPNSFDAVNAGKAR